MAAFKKRGTPLINLVSACPSLAGSVYVGIDNAAAGRSAGELLARFTRGRKGSLGILIGSATLRVHAERRFGCEQIVRSMAPERDLVFIGDGFDNRGRTEMLVREALKTRDLAGIYSAGAGNGGVLAALQDIAPEQRPDFIGHELTPHLRKALVDGIASAVIAQDSKAEIEAAIAALKAMVDGQVQASPAPIGIQIFIRGNLPQT